MTTIYALIWRSSATDDEFDQAEFERRIPRLMEWLRGLYAQGKLVGCGGGGFERHSGGLTLIRAEGIEEAQRISAEHPMNEIGENELLIWDLFYADLVEKEHEATLKKGTAVS